MVTDDIPTLKLSGNQSCGIETAISSITELCRDFEVVDIEPFYDGVLSNPSLITGMSKIYIVTISDEDQLFNAISAFSEDSNIEFAELYALPQPMYEPDDPYLFEQWYIYHTQLVEAWDIVRGDTTRHSIIGIVDSGVDWDHPEIQPNIWISTPEDLNNNSMLDGGDINGIDDDGNGFVDDVIGWDFGESDNDPQESALVHGTPVASCASAVTDNGIGIASSGFSSRIMCLKGFDDQGYPTGLWQSIIYAADNGAHIINCSWATPIYSNIEQDMINYVHDSGALVIASASATSDTIPAYPCGYENVMAVTSTDQNDHKAIFASYGTWVDISAPGIDILAVVSDSYNYYSGTSFSAALVSGLAGLMWSWYPSYSNEEIQQLIEDNADPIDYLNPGFEGLLGAGRINAFNCIITEIKTDLITPKFFTLSQNYPNPFNAQTTIQYSLPLQSEVTISIYDILGQTIETIDEGIKPAAEHRLIWNSEDYSSGIYFYTIKFGDYTDTKKMVLLK